MFAWSLPVDARAMLMEVAQSWGATEVAVPYTGMFAIERALSGLPLRFHSADVEITSAALAAAWLDMTFAVGVAPDYAERWSWLEPYLDTAERAAATLILSSNMALGLDQPRNPYYARLHRAFQSQWEKLHPSTAERVRAAKPNLASYRSMDPLAWLTDLIDPTMPVIYGAGVPTTLRGVNDLFAWDNRPAHEKPDMAAIVECVTARERWAIATPTPLDLPDNLVGYCRTTNMAPAVHVYASGGPYRTRQPAQLLDSLLLPRLAGDERPVGPVTLQRLSVREFAALRSRYLNPMIDPASPRLAVAVLAAGKLVGAYALNDSDGKTQVDHSLVPQPYAYLLSDFPVGPGVRKLAKFVLLAALTRESQLLMEPVIGHRVRGLFTTAFSDHAVSQKYRGIFDLVSRKEREGAHKKYALNYAARLGGHHLDDVLALWGK